MSGNLYKDLYDAEWVRRDQLQSSVAVPVGLLTLLGGGLVVYTHKYDDPAGLSTTFFWLCIGVTLGCYAWAVILLVRSYHGYTYQRLPWASQLREYHEGLLKYHGATGGTVEHADREFEEFLLIAISRRRIATRGITRAVVPCSTKRTVGLSSRLFSWR
jgi:hypothetical protein